MSKSCLIRVNKAVRIASDNVFGPISVGPGEAALVEGYLGDQDFAANTRRAVVQDLRKFAALVLARPMPSHSASAG